MGKDTKEKGMLFGKIVKIVLLVVITCIVIFVAHTMRNYFIMKNIIELQDNLSYVKNATVVLNSYRRDGDEPIARVKYYKKNTLEKMTMASARDIESPVFTEYRDTVTGESITVCDAENSKYYTKRVIEYNDKSLFHINANFNGFEDNTRTMLTFAIHSVITTENYYGHDCYKIVLFGKEIWWIEKETGLLIGSGNLASTTYNVRTYDFSVLDDKIFEIPDLTGYEERTYNEN